MLVRPGGRLGLRAVRGWVGVAGRVGGWGPVAGRVGRVGCVGPGGLVWAGCSERLYIPNLGPETGECNGGVKNAL